MSCTKKHALRNELKLAVRSLLEQAAARCQLGQLGNVPTVAQLRKSLTRRAPEKKKCPSGDVPDILNTHQFTFGEARRSPSCGTRIGLAAEEALRANAGEANSHGFSRGVFRLEKRIRPRCCLDDFLGFDGSVPWRYNGETVPCKAIEFGAPPKTFTFRPKTHGTHRKGGPKITGLKFKGQASNSCCCVISMLSLNEIP